MIPRGSFRCRLCDERYHIRHKEERPRSFFPERTITLCEFCLEDYKYDPEYEHLRPDVDPEEKQEIESRREYYKDTHIFF